MYCSTQVLLNEGRAGYPATRRGMRTKKVRTQDYPTAGPLGDAMSKRKNKAVWAATALPKIVSKQVESESFNRRQAQLRAESLGWETSAVGAGATASLTRSADSLHGWEMSDFFWITEAMTRVALDASTDMPGFVPEAEAPAPAGLMAFETSLPTITAPRPLFAHDGTKVEQAPVDAVRWYKAAVRFCFEFLCRTENFGPHLIDPAAPFQEIYAVWVNSTSLIFDEITDSGIDVSLVALIGAAWHLMQQPTVATPQPRAAGTGTPRGPRQPEERPSAVVTTVDLRTMRFVDTDREPDPDDTGRTYAHRWVVRGHWRNQPHGKARAQRRLQWVPSYTKGPEGAPLLASEKVMVWRR